MENNNTTPTETPENLWGQTMTERAMRAEAPTADEIKTTIKVMQAQLDLVAKAPEGETTSAFFSRVKKRDTYKSIIKDLAALV